MTCGANNETHELLSVIGKKENSPKGRWSEMTNYAFVLDADEKPLAPTKEVKAWYMIRKGKAKLVSKYPMTIQLKRVIPQDENSSRESKICATNWCNNTIDDISSIIEADKELEQPESTLWRKNERGE